MNKISSSLKWLVAATVIVASIPLAANAQTGGFWAFANGTEFNGTGRSVLYYDMASPADPIFAVILGADRSTPSGSPDYADINEMAIDRATGNTYVIDFDSGTTIGGISGGTGAGTGFKADGSTDYDLYQIDFTAAYDAYVNNGSTFVVMWDQEEWGHDFDANGFTDPGLAPGDFGLIDPITFLPNPTLDVTGLGVVDKIGELPRPLGDSIAGGSFYTPRMEFIDSDTLIVVDQTRVDIDALAGAGTTQADELSSGHQITVFSRTSTSPGSAPGMSDTRVNNDADPLFDDGFIQGGTNNGTSESWIATAIGISDMDFGSGWDEPEQIAFINLEGVMGYWIGDGDGGTNVDPVSGDDIGFFQITNLTGFAGNGLREFNVGPGPTFPNTFVLDDNPVADASSNDGAHDSMIVTPDGHLVILESGFFDSPQDEPSVITREVTSYDVGGLIDFGAWGYTQLDMTGLPDDDSHNTDGRFAFYDWINHDVYFIDLGDADFLNDLYKLDLDTGVSSLVAANFGDLAPFDNTRPTEFFWLGDLPEGWTAGIPIEELFSLADFNMDGFVDGADFSFFLGEWGSPGGPPFSDADFNFDGEVDGADFSFFLGEWNPAPPGINSIPEPTSLALLALGGLALLRRSRR